MEYARDFQEFMQRTGKTDLLAILGFILGLLAFAPYLYEVVTRKSKPAISSWFVWASLSALTFFSSLDAGKVYPQTILYAILDPLVFFTALVLRQWSPFGREDKVALVIGVISLTVIASSPELALLGSLIGITVANIPVIKNIKNNPRAESLYAWLLFSIAGLCSLLSGIIYFTAWIDLVTPTVYASLCCITTYFIIRGKMKSALVKIEP